MTNKIKITDQQVITFKDIYNFDITAPVSELEGAIVYKNKYYVHVNSYSFEYKHPVVGEIEVSEDTYQAFTKHFGEQLTN